MSGDTTTPKGPTGKAFNLSELVHAPIHAAGGRVGTLKDFVIVDKNKYADITHLVVERPFGRPPLVVPWEKVRSFRREKIVLKLGTVERYANAFPQPVVLLKDYILDKKVLDQRGRELEVVYDIGMTLTKNRLLVLDVDLSKTALLRRVRLGWLAKLFATSPDGPNHDRVPWSFVETLPEEIGSFQGDLKLKVLKEQLAELPPVDLADILEELAPEQRMAIFEKLDTESASDTLEALDPKVQRDLIASLNKEKAARLINQMTPGQAADLLAVLPWWEGNVLVALLADKRKARKITAILQKQEGQVIDFSHTGFLRFPPEKTVGRVRTEFAKAARNKGDITYVHVIDREGNLVGIVATKALLLAERTEKLQDIMTTKLVSLTPQSTLGEASELFARYLFRTLPVTDENGKMLGVLPYRDVVALRHRFVK